MPDLKAFAAAFANEDQLRRSIFTLLSKMPRIHGVEILHGSQEYGKDIIFYSEGGFDELILNACVVKNEKISGSADTTAGARNVFNQVEQALDTPYINREGKNEQVARVHVISPYDCPQITMRSIQGKIAERSGQVTFLCGSLLWEKFAKFWPDFLVFEATILGKYVKELERTASHSAPLAFLMSEHRLLSTSVQTFSDIYVRPHFQETLQKSVLLAQLPTIGELEKKMSREAVSNYSGKMKDAAQLLMLPQVWESGGEITATRVASSLLKWGQGIVPSWDRELQKNLSVRNSAEALCTALTSDDAKQLAPLVSDASHALLKFSRCVDKANAFAIQTSDLLNVLNDESYLNYCRIQEVARLVPGIFRNDGPPKVLGLPTDLLDRISHPLLITAPPGYGKTSFCKWNVLNDIKQLAQAKNQIPIYVPLHQLSNVLIESNEVFLQSADTRELFLNSQKNNRRIRFYLDGLDEVSTIDQQRRIMEHASNLVTEYPNVHLIVTARSYISGVWLRWIPRINLAALDDSQVERLVSNWLASNSEEMNEFNAQLASARTLRPLMRVPLLATLIIAVFKKKKEIPNNRLELYKVFIDLLTGGWDLAKNIRREEKFGADLKLSILTTFAGTLQSERKKEAQEADFESAVMKSAPALRGKWHELLEECLRDGLLVATGALIAFAHLSFQEYLAAKDLADPAEGRHLTILNAFLLGDENWREVMSFYVAMTNRPDEVYQWIMINKPRTALGATGNESDINSRKQFLVKSIADGSPGWRPKTY